MDGLLQNGGGIYVKNVKQLVLNNTLIENSYAKDRGGGIYLNSLENLNISHCLLKNNSVFFD